MNTRSRMIIDKTEAVGDGGMVAAMHPLAAEAGAEILKQGGNAIDAAVATAFAVGVVEPFMSGVGGIAFMVYHDTATGETACFDGSSRLPQNISADMFEALPGDETSGFYGWRATKDDAAQQGWLSPAVPGMPRLCGESHRRFGRLDWSELLQPAIKLAGDGFPVDAYVASEAAWNYEKLSKVAETRRTFIKPNGVPYRPASFGAETVIDRLVQADLANTLRLIASEGPETVYTGKIAEKIAADMANNGGVITEDDLAAHVTSIVEPFKTGYRGYDILGQLENTGNATVVEALKILEGYDLEAAGFQSTDAVHLIIEAIRCAFLDRLRYLGDSSLQPVPYQGAISAEYAAIQRETIDPNWATPDVTPGDPWPFDPLEADAQPQRSGVAGDGLTTHITVIDRDHNMVSLTSTLGSAFGSGVVIKDTGILLNNGTMWFDPEPGAVTSIGPGKRILSAASPVVVLRDGKPFAALGSPGGRRVISAVYQVLVNMIDFDRGIQQAISAPRAHSEGPVVEISSRFPEPVLEELMGMGHQLVIHTESPAVSPFARPNGIRIDPESGRLHGGAHQFTPATAVGIA